MTAGKIGAVIARKMAQLGLNQAALAAKVSALIDEPIGSAAVGRWARGEVVPGAERQRALCEIFGLTIDQLHGMQEINAKPVDHVTETHTTVDDYLHAQITRRLSFDQQIRPLPRIRHRFMPLRPDLMVENDKGPLFAVFVFQGGQQVAFSIVGAAELWRQTGVDVPFYALWVQQGAVAVDTELLGDSGVLEGLDCAPAAEVPNLIASGELFAGFLHWAESQLGYSRKGAGRQTRKGNTR